MALRWLATFPSLPAVLPPGPPQSSPQSVEGSSHCRTVCQLGPPTCDGLSRGTLPLWGACVRARGLGFLWSKSAGAGRPFPSFAMTLLYFLCLTESIPLENILCLGLCITKKTKVTYPLDPDTMIKVTHSLLASQPSAHHSPRATPSGGDRAELTLGVISEDSDQEGLPGGCQPPSSPQADLSLPWDSAVTSGPSSAWACKWRASPASPLPAPQSHTALGTSSGEGISKRTSNKNRSLTQMPTMTKTKQKLNLGINKSNLSPMPETEGHKTVISLGQSWTHPDPTGKS